MQDLTPYLALGASSLLALSGVLVALGLVAWAQMYPDPSREGGVSRWPLARMDLLNLLLSLVVGLIVGPLLPVFGLMLMLGVALGVRPRRFTLSHEGIRVEWPFYTRLIPLSHVTACKRTDQAEIRARWGWGFRFGSGGFLGGFGKFICPRRTWWLFVSRVEGLVAVEVSDGRPWLVTPEDPTGFCAEVERLQAAARR